ncbi:MAG: DPP IV N-terminal domain-containing protein, partial [Rhodothermales bacterium]
DRNLYVVDLATGSETQLTFDGSEGGVINGTTDWVYEEEFGLRDGWSWSPNSRRIAYVQMDESETREFVMVDLRNQYPEETRFKYPKAGEINSEIHVGVLDVETGDNTFFDTGTWFAGGDSLEYIPQLGWTPELEGAEYVWMFRLNRDQNELDLLYGDPMDGSVEVILEESSDSWLDVETSFGDLSGGTLTYLEDGRGFVWLSERDGHRHLYLYTNGGAFVRKLTSGAWNVTSFHGIDLEGNELYFTGTVDGPLERHLYRSVFDAAGTNGRAPAPMKITQAAGTHDINMSRDLRYYIDTFASVSTPGNTTLHRADGQRLKMLEDNEEIQERIADYELPTPEFLQVPASDGTMLNAYIIKPNDFDPSRKYPLLMYVYGGPGSQEVRNEWGGSRYLWHAYLAEEKDVIVACVDNRGTGGRSRDFKSITYKRLGVVEAEDQIAAARHFRGLDFVDENRIGIWGWSYGGYVSTLSL